MKSKSIIRQPKVRLAVFVALSFTGLLFLYRNLAQTAQVANIVTGDPFCQSALSSFEADRYCSVDSFFDYYYTCNAEKQLNQINEGCIPLEKAYLIAYNKCGTTCLQTTSRPIPTSTSKPSPTIGTPYQTSRPTPTLTPTPVPTSRPTPTPTPTPKPIPSPQASCRPRPTCLDTNPRCLIPETSDMCHRNPTPTLVPTPTATSIASPSPTPKLTGIDRAISNFRRRYNTYRCRLDARRTLKISWQETKPLCQ